MKTEKLSGSIWVDRYTLTRIFEENYIGSVESSKERPFKLTITAKMPERKREFTESEIIEILKSGDSIGDIVKGAFKGVE